MEMSPQELRTYLALVRQDHSLRLANRKPGTFMELYKELRRRGLIARDTRQHAAFWNLTAEGEETLALLEKQLASDGKAVPA